MNERKRLSHTFVGAALTHTVTGRVQNGVVSLRNGFPQARHVFISFLLYSNDILIRILMLSHYRILLQITSHFVRINYQVT